MCIRDRSRGWQFGDWWNKNCSSSARRVYRRLGDIDNATSLRDLVVEFGSGPANEGVEVLQHVGIGSMDEETLEVKKLGRMFANWHIRFGGSADADTHDEKIAEKLRGLDPDLMAKYVSAWRILGSDMPNYSGAVSELRDTDVYKRQPKTKGAASIRCTTPSTRQDTEIQ